ncbi:peptidoglycan-binding domain-containing protein [Actinoplanes sp. NPDC023936]|uniref:peptidoglycan-binding domain-containing protein n=1 Tax=Actinoplanes sp. NPDC023936 TaxID=3154910 RepID=UPI0033E57071
MVISRRRLLWVLPGAAVTAGAAVAGLRWRGGAPAGGAAPAASASVATAEVERRDLAVSQILPGVLGHGPARPVRGARPGTVTWLPEAGRTIGRGGQVYRVDDQPVALFYGSLPLFRPLAVRDLVGRDVRVVADNLKALGYRIGRQPRAGTRVAQAQPPAAAPVTPASSPAPTSAKGPAAATAAPVTVRAGDGVFTASLIKALRRWQRDTGLPVTGAIGPGDVVVLAGAIRVDSVTAQPGDDATTALLTVTRTAKVITVTAEPEQAATIKQGAAAVVSLPDARRVPGRVTEIGTELQIQAGDGADPNARPKFAVTIAATDPKVLDRLDSADVEVEFAGEIRTGVLAVPVAALVALSEGGYAVQMDDGRLVAVEVGMFAKGFVEVSGDGLEPGRKVVATS